MSELRKSFEAAISALTLGEKIKLTKEIRSREDLTDKEKYKKHIELNQEFNKICGYTTK